MGLRLSGNEARRILKRKTFGRQFPWFWPSLSQASQPAPGMLRLLRPAQTPKPPH